MRTVRLWQITNLRAFRPSSSQQHPVSPLVLGRDGFRRWPPPPVPYRHEIVDSILTVTETLGKAVHLIPLPSTATASQVADLYHDSIYRLHGLPDAIISNRDPKFTSGFWRALHRKVGTKLRMSTLGHPQTDGQLEVTNKTVGTVLRILVEDNL